MLWASWCRCEFSQLNQICICIWHVCLISSFGGYGMTVPHRTIVRISIHMRDWRTNMDMLNVYVSGPCASPQNYSYLGTNISCSKWNYLSLMITYKCHTNLLTPTSTPTSHYPNNQKTQLNKIYYYFLKTQNTFSLTLARKVPNAFCSISRLGYPTCLHLLDFFCVDRM